MKHIFAILSFSILVSGGCQRSDPVPQTLPIPVHQAPVADPPLVDEKSPEWVLRAFLLAMAERDAEMLGRVGNGEGPIELLLAGSPLNEAQLKEAKRQIEEMRISRLKAGDTIPYPGGGEIKLNEEDVNASRLKLMTPNSPLPFDLQRFDGVWYVNVDPIIAVRKAAAKLRQEDGQ